jgi:hypothetical protein
MDTPQSRRPKPKNHIPIPFFKLEAESRARDALPNPLDLAFPQNSKQSSENEATTPSNSNSRFH